MIPKRLHTFLLVLITAANTLLFSQYNYIFEHLSTKDGLSHNSVSGMIKDKNGFMWFATWDGLSRYDGENFKVYKLDEGYSNSASNRIASLKEDVYGNIWITTYDNKVFRFNTLTESFEAVSFVNSDSVKAVIKEVVTFDDGDIWVVSNQSGACFIKTNNTTNTINLSVISAPNKLPDNEIIFVVNDALDNTWVSTGKGMVVLSENEGEHELVALPLKTKRILQNHLFTAHAEDDERLIFGTKTGELLVIDKKRLTCEVKNIGSSVPIVNLCLQKAGALYAGTKGEGVFEFDMWKDTVTYHYNDPLIRQVLKMYLDSKGMLWVESTEAGISSIHVRSRKFQHHLQTLDVNPDMRASAQCGLIEGEHYLWLTLKGGGFGYYNYQTEKLEYFFNEPESTDRKLSNFVNSFYKDPSGVLWMSTYFRGIEKISLIQKRFQFIQPAPQSKYSIANEVRALLYDSKGYLWVATKNQEVYILTSNWEVKKKITSLANESIGRVYSMYEDKMGTIYLGSKGNGLFVLKPQGDLTFSSKHYTYDTDDSFSISNDNIYDIHEDNKGNIWLGTYGGGVNRFDGERFYHAQNGRLNYPTNMGLKVRCITNDAKGNLWVGTTDGILFLSDDTADSVKAFSVYSAENGLLEGIYGSDIFWILSDKQGTIWVASLGGGLSKLTNYPGNKAEPLKFTSLRKENGLPSDMVFTIVNDEQDNLWMATENGIVFYDTKTKLVKEYGQYAGIENTFFSEGAMAKDADGNIVVGAKNGFYYFNPLQFNNEAQKVNLLFTDFKIFGESVTPGDNQPINYSIARVDNVELKHNQNAFSITWAGLDYGLQNRLQFSYQLIGYDDNWQLAKDRNEATYTKIPPGNYTFQLQFLNPELQKVNEPISLSIRVKPPFWRSIWAYLFYAVVILVMVEILRRAAITIIRLRNKVVVEKELSELKLNFFTNISHELRTPLTLIQGPVKEIKMGEKLSDKGKGYVSLIEDNTKRLLNLVNQLLDFRKIQHQKMTLKVTNVNVAALVKDVARHFNARANEKQIRFTVTVSTDELTLQVDQEKIRTVLFNLLANAFKFTPTLGIVDVLLYEQIDEHLVCIEVRDNGKGITREEEATLFTPFMSQGNATTHYLKGTGIGLALSKELVNLHDGELNYRPQLSGGSLFSVSLPSKLLATSLINQDIPVSTVFTETEETVNPVKSAEVNQLNKPCVLLVEDNEDLRQFLHLQLSDDYQIVQAENGVQGLEIAMQIQPDLILTDIMMPLMDGIELLDKIKHNNDTSHIPVVLLTAKTSVESKIEGLNYGADAYLTKPYERDQLKAQLDNILQQRKILRDYYSHDSDSINLHEDVKLTESDKTFLVKVQDLIEQNLSNTEFKMETLYSHLGMGRSKFSNKLKGLTGVSPVEFVRAFRLNKADILLKTGEYNVSEVSYMAGFTDPAYFSKSYKDKFGVNPSDTRKK